MKIVQSFLNIFSKKNKKQKITHRLKPCVNNNPKNINEEFLVVCNKFHDIDKEYQKVQELYDKIKELEAIDKVLVEPHVFMSKEAYGELDSHGQVIDDMIYYLIEPELGQYLNGYIFNYEEYDEVSL